MDTFQRGRAVTRYVVEVALDGGYLDVRGLSLRARAAAEAVSASADVVRFVRTVYVPEDDACLLILEAGTAGAARDVAAAAGMRVTRVSQTLTIEEMSDSHRTSRPGR